MTDQQPRDYAPDDRLLYDEPEHDRWTLRLVAFLATFATLAVGFGFAVMMGWW